MTRGHFNAFTLAEVLITLGIIGVVAAMTMPTLINSTQGAQYKAAYKKALSAISQGVTLNVALDGGSFADTVGGTAGSIDPATGTTGDTVGSILHSRMNIVKVSNKTDSGYGMDGEGETATSKFPGKVKSRTCTTTDGKETCTDGEDVVPDTFLFFNDGTMFAFEATTSKGCLKDQEGSTDYICRGVIDVNGTKGPNKVVKCDQEDATEANCTVSNPTDIYPVEFYNQTILPASAAAKAVLYGK